MKGYLGELVLAAHNAPQNIIKIFHGLCSCLESVIINPLVPSLNQGAVLPLSGGKSADCPLADSVRTGFFVSLKSSFRVFFFCEW